MIPSFGASVYDDPKVYTHCAAEGGFELSAYPTVRGWLARVAAQPGYIPLSEKW